MMIEPFYITDTNALYWFLSGDRKLSKVALTVFQAAQRGETQIGMSAITIAELYLVNRKWKGFHDFVKVYAMLKNSAEFLIVPFDRDSDVPEMHDRIIVGLARRLNAPLITSDGKITSSGLVQVVW